MNLFQGKIKMKVTLRTVVKNLNTLTFYVEEKEIDVSLSQKCDVEINNLACAFEVQKLLEEHWFYGKPPEIKSKRKKNFIENCFKRLGLKK